MDTQQMKMFLTVASSLNFTNAASQLYITQPALSRNISAIERELNVQLFVRTGRALKLTPAGRILRDSLKRIYSDYNEAIESVRLAAKGKSGRFNIGMINAANASDVLQKTKNFFSTKYPNVELGIYSDECFGLISGLYNKKNDVILAPKYELEGLMNIEYKEIYKATNHFLVDKNSKLAQKERISLSELKGETIVSLSPNQSPRGHELLCAEFRKLGFMPEFIYSENRFDCVVLVLAGMGVTLTDSQSCQYRSPLVKALTLDEPIYDPSFCLAWYTGSENELLEPYLREMLGNNYDN